MTITPGYIKTDTYLPNSMLLGYYKQYKLYCIIDWTIVMLMVCITVNYVYMELYFIVKLKNYYNWSR